MNRLRGGNLGVGSHRNLQSRQQAVIMVGGLLVVKVVELFVCAGRRGN